jgi:hypothetical protein
MKKRPGSTLSKFALHPPVQSKTSSELPASNQRRNTGFGKSKEPDMTFYRALNSNKRKENAVCAMHH